MKIWTEDHKIRSYEVDPRGCISVPAVCNYMQEAAANHAHALGVSILQLVSQNITWVLSRMALRIDTYPGWGDLIGISTWPSGVRGPFALRDFCMTGKDRLPIAAAVSAWLLIDAKTRLPLRRVQPVLDRLHPPKADHTLSNPLGKLPRIEGHDHEEPFSVQYSDLDINRHVNNVRYISWVLGSLSPEMLDNAFLTDLEVNFLAEAFSGEQILARCKKTEAAPLSFLHVLLRKEDGQELVRARTSWRPGRKDS